MISQLKLKTWEESARPNPSENCKGDLVGIRFDSLYFDSLSFYNADMKPLKISIEIVYFSKRGRQIHTFFLLPSPYAPREDAAFVYYPLVLAKAPTPVVRAMVVWFNAKFFARMDPMLIPADIMLSSIQIWVNSIVDLKKEHNDMIEMSKNL
jgi:CHASE1-domain containing sensor protein